MYLGKCIISFAPLGVLLNGGHETDNATPEHKASSIIIHFI
jgi:hypothetical protein